MDSSRVGQVMFKTFSATPTDIQQDWYVVDAEGMVLGRLATEVARIIRGKHKPIFTPHMDTG
ncbi:MAG: uL13 family ribosomal protein, partial [Gemmatimonadaceae bacterium]